MKNCFKRNDLLFSMVISFIVAVLLASCTTDPVEPPVSPPTPVIATELPELIGLQDGAIITSPLTIDWVDKSGCESKFFLKKDGPEFIERLKGSVISEQGNYTLKIITENISNKETKELLLNFIIDFNADKPAELPEIAGLQDGAQLIEPLTLDWVESEGCESKVFIKKDNGSFQEYTKGSKVSAPGTYTAKIVTTRVISSDKRELLANFTIDFKAKMVGITANSIYTYYVMGFLKKHPGTNVVAHLTKPDNSVESYSDTKYIKIDGETTGTEGQYKLVITTTRLSDSLTDSEILTFQLLPGNPLATFKTNIGNAGTSLTLDFKHKLYDKYNWSPYNEKAPAFAIWVESASGDFIENLYLSAMIATNYVKYENRWEAKPHTAPYWSHKACKPAIYNIDQYFRPTPTATAYELYLPNMDDLTTYPELDAVTGATPEGNFILDTVTKKESGKIRVVLELNQSLDYGWYYQETKIDGATINNHFYRDSGEPALVYAAEIDLDSPQTVYNFTLVGYSHYAGEDGKLYTNFNGIDTQGKLSDRFEKAKDMVDSITVTVTK